MQLSGDSLALAKDLNNRFDSMIRKERDGLHKRVCEIVPSTTAFEKYPMITSVPFPTEWTDMNTPTGIRVTNVLEVDNLMYRQHIEIDANLVNDNQAWTLKNLLTRAAQRATAFKDKLCSALLDAGINANTPSITDPTTAFYATTKSFGGLGKNTFSNKLTGSGITALQVATDLAAAVSAFEQILDDQGGLVNDVIQQNATNLLIRSSPALKLIFTQILNGSWLPLLSGASGDNVQKGMADHFSDGYMADKTDWEMHVIAEGYRPFLLQIRESLRSKLYTPNDDKDCDKRNVIEIVATERLAFAYGFPEHSIRVVNS